MTYEFLVFRGKKGISDTDFVYYLSRFDEVRRFAELNMQGTSGRQRVNRKAFDHLELSLPSLPTQRRIAAVLSALDDKIELNRQTNATLEAIAQAIFKEWFVHFNYPGASSTGSDSELVESDLGLIPAGWRVGKVKDLCNVNSNSITKNDQFDWIDYIEISQVSKGKIGDVKRHLFGEQPSRAKRKLRHGDTVLSTVRPGRGSYFLALYPPHTLIASTGFAIFSPSKAPYSFIYLLLTNSEKIEFYGHVADGAAYPSISPNLIMNMDLVIPETNILNEFHVVIKSLFERIHFFQQESQQLAKIRDALLPKLLRGEIKRTN